MLLDAVQGIRERHHMIKLCRNERGIAVVLCSMVGALAVTCSPILVPRNPKIPSFREVQAQDTERELKSVTHRCGERDSGLCRSAQSRAYHGDDSSFLYDGGRKRIRCNKKSIYRTTT